MSGATRWVSPLPPAVLPVEIAPLRPALRRLGLKLPDCCALDTALQTGSTLATFDEALAAAARTCGLTVAPGR